MTGRDPFDVLGLEPGADEAAVRDAFRAKAKLYHPDTGAEASVERFREAKQAYDVLKDPAKRAEAAARRASPAAAPAGMASQFNDFFETVALHGRTREIRAGRRVADPGESVLTLTLEQAFAGGEFPFGGTAPCADCRGAGLVDTGSPRTCPDCRGHGFTRAVKGFVSAQLECPTCKGRGVARVAKCQSCSGTGVDASSGDRKVKIPAGCRDGFKVRLGGGAGDKGWPVNGGATVTVRVLPHARFKPAGEDLLTELEVPVWMAALGGRLSIAGIDGAEVSVRVPAGSQHGTEVVVPGAGMHAFSGRGSLRARLSLRVPDASGGALRRAYEAARDAEGG